jgi:uncharacterized glyoxalase superfamily protein PhnB
MPHITEAPRLFVAYRYRDPEAAIRWFVETLGFRERARYLDGSRIAHAELVFGASILMLGQAAADSPVADPGSAATYVAVDDPDVLFARIAASGVRIEAPPADRPHGSREFTCRDPEGNLWCFGTYWPRPDEAPGRSRPAC